MQFSYCKYVSKVEKMLLFKNENKVLTNLKNKRNNSRLES